MYRNNVAFSAKENACYMVMQAVARQWNKVALPIYYASSEREKAYKAYQPNFIRLQYWLYQLSEAKSWGLLQSVAKRSHACVRVFDD